MELHKNSNVPEILKLYSRQLNNIIFSKSKRGQTPMLISDTMQKHLSSFHPSNQALYLRTKWWNINISHALYSKEAVSPSQLSSFHTSNQALYLRTEWWNINISHALNSKEAEPPCQLSSFHPPNQALYLRTEWLKINISHVLYSKEAVSPCQLSLFHPSKPSTIPRNGMIEN